MLDKIQEIARMPTLIRGAVDDVSFLMSGEGIGRGFLESKNASLAATVIIRESEAIPLRRKYEALNEEKIAMEMIERCPYVRRDQIPRSEEVLNTDEAIKFLKKDREILSLGLSDTNEDEKRFILEDYDEYIKSIPKTKEKLDWSVFVGPIDGLCATFSFIHFLVDCAGSHYVENRELRSLYEMVVGRSAFRSGKFKKALNSFNLLFFDTDFEIVLVCMNGLIPEHKMVIERLTGAKENILDVFVPCRDEKQKLSDWLFHNKLARASTSLGDECKTMIITKSCCKGIIVYFEPFFNNKFGKACNNFGYRSRDMPKELEFSNKIYTLQSVMASANLLLIGKEDPPMGHMVYARRSVDANEQEVWTIISNANKYSLDMDSIPNRVHYALYVPKESMIFEDNGVHARNIEIAKGTERENQRGFLSLIYFKLLSPLVQMIGLIFYFFYYLIEVKFF